MNLTPEQIAARLAQRNPFATRSVRPGVVRFRFYDGSSLESLVERLREHGWSGEIVGPHGSGKSTLLHSLLNPLREAGRDVRLIALHRGDSRLPVSGTDLQSWSANTQIVIDGYEQLGGWTRTLLSRIRRKEGCGLLLTSHEPTGLPVLYRTAPNVEMVQALVRDLQPNGRLSIRDSDVATSFERQNGNVREVFFELYNLYEQRNS